MCHNRTRALQQTSVNSITASAAAEHLVAAKDGNQLRQGQYFNSTHPVKAHLTPIGLHV
jgi:hypothetical protein